MPESVQVEPAVDPVDLLESFHSPPPSPQPAIILGSSPPPKAIAVVKENGHASNGGVRGAPSPKPAGPAKRPPRNPTENGNGVPSKGSATKGAKNRAKKAAGQYSQAVPA